MNFTHLLPDSREPAQELLQRYSHYLVIAALDNDMEELILDTARFNLASSEDVLCQIVRPGDFDIALPGSLLHRIKATLAENPRTPQQLNHSFLAIASRRELISRPIQGGEYVPLLLYTLNSREEREAHLLDSISRALARAHAAGREDSIRNKFKAASTAASFVASIFRISHGSPM